MECTLKGVLVGTLQYINFNKETMTMLNFTYKKPKELISKGNPKLLKGLKRGWLDEGWCGAQSDVSVAYGGIEMCANKSPRCNDLCIFKQGRGRFSNVQISRIRKSIYFAQEKAELYR